MKETPKKTSPFFLMQERFREEPWKLLVCCILLNLVSGKSARPVWERFFERWPTPESLWGDERPSETILGEMSKLLRPLGFQNRRATRIWRMTFDYLVLRPETDTDRVGQLHGVGKYAADSFKMFVGGHLVEDVQDKELKRYVEWARTDADR